VAKLGEIDIKIGQGKDVLSTCREAGATDNSYYRWRRVYPVSSDSVPLKHLPQIRGPLQGVGALIFLI